MGISNLSTNYEPLSTELQKHECDAYIHIGDRFDDSLRYLTRFSGPDRNYVFVYTPDKSVLCAPSLFKEQAQREFAGDLVLGPNEQESHSAVGRALEVLKNIDDVSDVLVSSSIEEADYTKLENEYKLKSDADLDIGRKHKSFAEQKCHEEVQAAAQRGMARAETILSEAGCKSARVVWQNEPLTTERLRREVNATIAGCGVRDAGNTVIGAGPSCADLHFTDCDYIRPHETILLDISPRGPYGYYGDLTRTFILGDVREWEATAYEAVTKAQDSALEILSGGANTCAKDSHEAACDTLSKYGFGTGDVEIGMYHSIGHGIGISLHEGPRLRSDEPLEIGNVVTVEPGVYDPERGGVRIEDIVVIVEDGYQNITDYPRSIRPSPNSHSW